MVKIISRWYRSIKEIKKEDMTALLGKKVSPFLQWDWLAALEVSGSVAAKSGWQPSHLALWEGETLVAFAPLYIKGHSYGEFVFDHAFSQLANDLGLNYYPKLLGMSPLSPIEGYRFYFANQSDEIELTILMIKIIDEFALRNRIISCNFLYVDPAWRLVAEQAGCATWLNQMSLWTAGEQKNFSDYLARFNSNQRRNIKRERKSIRDKGLFVDTLHGPQIDLSVLRKMYGFYEQHCARWGVWGSKYLSESFFEMLAGPDLREKIIVFSAHSGNPDEPLGMSLCVTDSEMLWGRYWGSKQEIDCLHFELCYYAPIEWALQNGIKGFDPGAGGSHKRRRGFLAKPHASLHRWYDKRMNYYIRSWLPKANDLMIEEINAANSDLPFNGEQPPLSFVG